MGFPRTNDVLHWRQRDVLREREGGRWTVCDIVRGALDEKVAPEWLVVHIELAVDHDCGRCVSSGVELVLCGWMR